MKQSEQAKILKQCIVYEESNEKILELQLHSPQIAAGAKPGQFVMLHLSNSHLLLPRPMSIMDADAANGSITIMYSVVGSGTKQMALLKPGEEIKITGPLGNGFKINPGNKKIAIVGGGMGSPPLLFLARTLKNVETHVFLGFRNEPFLKDSFADFTDTIHFSSDSGVFGFHGNVVDLLKFFCKSFPGQEYDEVYACGPKPMLFSLAEYAASKNFPCQISLEERMACGLGTCVGCVISTTEGRKKICVDGPVFNGITLQEHFPSYVMKGGAL